MRCEGSRKKSARQTQYDVECESRKNEQTKRKCSLTWPIRGNAKRKLENDNTVACRTNSIFFFLFSLANHLFPLFSYLFLGFVSRKSSTVKCLHFNRKKETLRYMYTVQCSFSRWKYNRMSKVTLSADEKRGENMRSQRLSVRAYTQNKCHFKSKSKWKFSN